MEEATLGKIRWNRIFCVLVLTLVVMELGAQFFFWRWAGEKYQSVRVNVWSPYGLVRNNPEVTSPEYKVNANGFRNLRSFNKKKPENTLRVFIMGASVMYSGLGGWFPADTQRVGTDQTVAQFLEEMLRNDSELGGIDVEVINAAVNFNRINEVSASYLDEYIFWDPDFVIVGGSANNFVIEPPLKGQIYEGNYNVQGWHPWRLEFERQVNDLRFLPLGERTVLTLEDRFAAPALARKLASRFNDKLTGLSVALGGRLQERISEPQQQRGSNPEEERTSQQFADEAEYGAYIDAYLGFLRAMIAAAQVQEQEVAFFWEYYLVQLQGIKPFSEAEERLYQGNLGVRPLIGPLHFNFQARDRIAEFCLSNQSMLIDPLEELKKFDQSVFIDYLHYTPTGNKFVAGVMYERLKEKFRKRARQIREEGAGS